MNASRRKQSGVGAAGDALMDLFRAIAAGDSDRALSLLEAAPALATARAPVGASRAVASDYFLSAIAHYVYAGDTALHVAAAAFSPRLVEALLERGAALSAKNRRGAGPLHYASDANRDAADAQAQTIRCLCAAGADPNALDASGVAALHRAVRTRGVSAVLALLAAGANPRAKNASGSTPLHLAVQNTGRGGTGTPAAIERQRQIIVLLLAHGALPSDVDQGGKTALEAARAGWMRELIARTGVAS
jgi:ankyrin repeat protein